MKKYKNKSTIIRDTYNGNIPYTRVSSSWNDSKKLNGYHRAIMLEIMSNSDDFVINKTVIKKRLGFPKKAFLDSWKELEDMGYIFSFKNGMTWEYAITEISKKDVKFPKVKQDNNIIDKPLQDHHTQDYLVEDHKLLLNKTTINNNYPETLDSRPKSRAKRAQGPDFRKTDTITSAEAEVSISTTELRSDILTQENNSISPVLKYDFGIADYSDESLFDLNDFISEGSLEIKPREIVIHKNLKVSENPLF